MTEEARAALRSAMLDATACSAAEADGRSYQDRVADRLEAAGFAIVKADVSRDRLCALLYDLHDRSGMDEALETCREHMHPDAVELLDLAIEAGRDVKVPW